MPDKLSPARGLVRMSWGPKNLYNLWRLSYSPPEHIGSNLSFKKTSLTLYQQKWSSKKMLRAYHGDWIPERRLRRRFIPDALPPLQAGSAGSSSSSSSSSRASTSTEGSRGSGTASLESDYSSRNKSSQRAEGRGRIPLGSLMWREVEARLDVLLFRACFVHSAYEARRMITQGHVKLNGQKCVDPNILLQPGDIFSVDPKEMYLLRSSDHPFETQKVAAEEEEVSEEQPEGEIEAAEASTSTSDVVEGGSSEATETLASPTGEAESSAPDSTPSDGGATSSSSSAAAKTSSSPSEASPRKAKKQIPGLPFDLPDYSAPFLFIPAYLEVSFPTCSAIYVRHPTARPGYSEIPTPYDADGEVMRLGWEFYKGVGRRRRGVKDLGDEDGADSAKDLWTEEGKRNWTANWDDTILEKRHMRAVRQGRGRWAHRPL